MSKCLQQTVGVTTTRYVNDPAAGLTQVLSDGTSTYLYGVGRIAQQGTSIQYYGADALGSVRQLYNSSGQILANTRYDPYGNVLSQNGDATSIYGFTGEQFDASTGLEYLRARFYDPAQGRFVSRDVWGGDPTTPMSYNAWSYVQGNPINFTDPSGHCTGGVGMGALSEASMLGYPFNPLAWPKVLEGLGQGFEKCKENLEKGKEALEQGNYAGAAAYSTGFMTMLEGGSAWIGEYNKDVEKVAGSRFAQMQRKEPATWFLRLRPEDLPELIEVGKADCDILGKGFTIASWLTPGVFAARSSLTRALSIAGSARGLVTVRMPGSGTLVLTGDVDKITPQQVRMLEDTLLKNNIDLGRIGVVYVAEMPPDAPGMTLGMDEFAMGPAAFTSEDEVLKTIYHELNHLAQRKLLGDPGAYGEMLERLAEIAEGKK